MQVGRVHSQLVPMVVEQTSRGERSFAIYDTIQYIRPDVQTICYGMAMSAGSLILAGGTKGKRLTLPNARILIHQPSSGFQGQSSDIEIHAREILELRRPLDDIYANHTGQTRDQVHDDMERDRF